MRLSVSRKKAHGWPYCEHDGTQRILGTAAHHVEAIRRTFPPNLARDVVRGVELLAAETAPEEVIGICPECFCMTTQERPAHR
jgi:dihydropteroate synthase